MGLMDQTPRWIRPPLRQVLGGVKGSVGEEKIFLCCACGRKNFSVP